MPARRKYSPSPPAALVPRGPVSPSVSGTNGGTVSQTPGGVALVCVAGTPFDVTVELQDGSGRPLSGVDDVTAAVYTRAGQETGSLAPMVTATDEGVYSLAWTSEQTAQLGLISGYRWALGCKIGSAGPYSILAGGVSATPPHQPGSSGPSSVRVAVTIGWSIQVTVIIG